MDKKPTKKLIRDLQQYRIYCIILIVFLITLKIFDIFITVIALEKGAVEQNVLGSWFYEEPFLIMIVSFVPIFFLLIVVYFYKNNLGLLKIAFYGTVIFTIFNFILISSNLIQLMVLL